LLRRCALHHDHPDASPVLARFGQQSDGAKSIALQGVERQVAAFTNAMRQVLPLSKLLVFTTAELLESVCGEAVHWDDATVRDCIVSTSPDYQPRHRAY